MDKWMDRKLNRNIYKQIDRWMNRQLIIRQTDIETNRPMHLQKD